MNSELGNLREAALVKNFGKRVSDDKCFCAVFRKECPANCKYKRRFSWQDHGRLYKNESKYVFISEPYFLNVDAMREISEIASENNLEVVVSAEWASWNPNRSIAVIFRSRSNL